MTYYYRSIILAAILLLGACKNEEVPTAPEEEKIEECILEGTFVRMDDSLSMPSETSDSLLIDELTFHPNYCTFTVDSIGYRGNYGCLNNTIWLAVKGFDTLRLHNESKEELRGEGQIEGHFVLKGSELYAALTIEEIETISDAENASNAVNPADPKKNPTPEKTNPEKVPTKITEVPVSTSNGKKTARVSFGDNLGGTTYRVRMFEPKTTSFKSDESARIYLMLSVDAVGNVVSAENNMAKTNTKNETLIKEIIALAKQIKYNKDPGAKTAKIPLAVRVDVK